MESLLERLSWNSTELYIPCILGVYYSVIHRVKNTLSVSRSLRAFLESDLSRRTFLTKLFFNKDLPKTSSVSTWNFQGFFFIFDIYKDYEHQIGNMAFEVYVSANLAPS